LKLDARREIAKHGLTVAILEALAAGVPGTSSRMVKI
jgi:hypothetical protein